MNTTHTNTVSIRQRVATVFVAGRYGIMFIFRMFVMCPPAASRRVEVTNQPPTDTAFVRVVRAYSHICNFTTGPNSSGYTRVFSGNVA